MYGVNPVRKENSNGPFAALRHVGIPTTLFSLPSIQFAQSPVLPFQVQGFVWQVFQPGPGPLPRPPRTAARTNRRRVAAHARHGWRRRLRAPDGPFESLVGWGVVAVPVGGGRWGRVCDVM